MNLQLRLTFIKSVDSKLFQLSLVLFLVILYNKNKCMYVFLRDEERICARKSGMEVFIEASISIQKLGNS